MIVTLKNNGFSAKIDSYGAQADLPTGSSRHRVYLAERPKTLGELLSTALPDRG